MIRKLILILCASSPISYSLLVTNACITRNKKTDTIAASGIAVISYLVLSSTKVLINYVGNFDSYPAP